MITITFILIILINIILITIIIIIIIIIWWKSPWPASSWVLHHHHLGNLAKLRKILLQPLCKAETSANGKIYISSFRNFLTLCFDVDQLDPLQRIVSRIRQKLVCLWQWSNSPLELIYSYFVKMHTRCFFTNKWFRRSCFSICIGFEDLCSEGFPACRDPTFIVLMYFQWKHYTRVPLNPFHSSTRSTRL